MANKIEHATVPSVTREMLATKIEELKSSVDQIDEGHLLDQAYGIISSISKKPYQVHIVGPLHIIPDTKEPDTMIIVGPVPVPPGTAPCPPAKPRSRTGRGQATSATVECPNCQHKLKIDISL